MLKRFFGFGAQEAGRLESTGPSALPIKTLDDLLAASVAFDLEISERPEGRNRLRDAAAFPSNLAAERAKSRGGMSAAEIVAELGHGRFVIGHNAAVHDIPELEGLVAQSLGDLELIDTIWVSPLAHPGLGSHALKKTYRAETSRADPVQDTLETIALLKSEVHALSRMDREWIEILRWLCGLGGGRAGYVTLFDVVLGQPAGALNGSLAGAKPVVDAIVRLFQGSVCMRGLHDQLIHAFRAKNGWPLAWALSWVRHRDERPAPAEWLLKGDLGFQEALDDLGRRRCSQTSCRRCRQNETSLDSMNRWFPPAEAESPCFQPPFRRDRCLLPATRDGRGSGAPFGARHPPDRHRQIALLPGGRT